MEGDNGDLSQLIPPIATSARSFTKLMAVYRTGTNEVQQLLGTGCNVILECNICSSLFRSVANFVCHRRSYCRRDQLPLEITQHGQSPESFATVETVSDELKKRDLDHIVGKLSEQASQTGSDGVVGENPEATQRVQYFCAVAEAVKRRQASRMVQTIALSPLAGTSKAVLQTVAQQKVCSPPRPPTPMSVVEKSSPISSSSSNVSTVGGSEEGRKKRGRPKKISLEQTSSKASSDAASRLNLPVLQNVTPSADDKAAPNYCCEKCHAQFTTQKSLTLHETTQHMTSRMQYKCPCCKNSFCNLWSTYRHLKSIHRKTSEQVERMKPVIRKRAFRMTVPVFRPVPSASRPTPLPPSPSPSPSSSPSINAKAVASKNQQLLDKAWVGNDNNFTVDVGDHRCGVCGLRFERRAALVSHTNTCHRRPSSTTAVARSGSSKSPGSSSPSVDVPVERNKPEGAANRKKNPPVRIIRGLKDAVVELEKLPDCYNHNESVSDNIVETPVKEIEEQPVNTQPTESVKTKEEDEMVEETVKETPIVNSVPISPIKPTENIVKTQHKDVIIENGFSKSSSASPANSESSASSSLSSLSIGSTENKIPTTIIPPPPVNPVVKLVYSKTNVVKPLLPPKRSPNIIKKSSANKRIAAITLPVLPTETQSSLEKPEISSNTEQQQSKTSTSDEKPLLQLNLSNFTPSKFITLKQVQMKSNGNVIANKVGSVSFSLTKSTNSNVKPCTVQNIPRILTKPIELIERPLPKLVPAPHKNFETNVTQNKAEIIVRTVSDKSGITNSKQSSVVNRPVNKTPPSNGTSPESSESSSIFARTSMNKSPSLHSEDSTEVIMLKHAPSAAIPASWFAAGPVDKTWDLPEKPRSGIQVRRDYGKVVSADAETSQSHESELSLDDESEEDDFTGWDENNVDDYRGQLGLPQINNASLVFSLIDDSNVGSSDSSSSDYPSPSSPPLLTAESGDDSSLEDFPLGNKRSGDDLEYDSSKRKRFEVTENSQ